MHTETIDFELSKEVTARPLERKGFNRHYINLVSADVFKPSKGNFIKKFKSLFFI